MRLRWSCTNAEVIKLCIPKLRNWLRRVRTLAVSITSMVALTSAIMRQTYTRSSPNWKVPCMMSPVGCKTGVRQQWQSSPQENHMKNLCSKKVTPEKAYEVWSNGTWTYYVLKKYQNPENEAKNPYARWYCMTTSPITPQGEY